MLQRLKKPDPLIVLIILAVIIAIIAPARGNFADIVGQLTNVAIALLFFLYGARLSTQEASTGSSTGGYTSQFSLSPVWFTRL